MIKREVVLVRNHVNTCIKITLNEQLLLTYVSIFLNSRHETFEELGDLVHFAAIRLEYGEFVANAVMFL